jgi:hypothetical protein
VSRRRVGLAANVRVGAQAAHDARPCSDSVSRPARVPIGGAQRAAARRRSYAPPPPPVDELDVLRPGRWRLVAVQFGQAAGELEARDGTNPKRCCRSWLKR